MRVANSMSSSADAASDAASEAPTQIAADAKKKKSKKKTTIGVTSAALVDGTVPTCRRRCATTSPTGW